MLWRGNDWKSCSGWRQISKVTLTTYRETERAGVDFSLFRSPELSELFEDFHTEVFAQGHEVSLLSENIASAVKDTDRGVVELDKARSYQKSNRKKMCLIICCVAIIAIIGMPQHTLLLAVCVLRFVFCRSTFNGAWRRIALIRICFFLSFYLSSYHSLSLSLSITHRSIVLLVDSVLQAHLLCFMSVSLSCVSLFFRFGCSIDSQSCRCGQRDARDTCGAYRRSSNVCSQASIGANGERAAVEKKGKAYVCV